MLELKNIKKYYYTGQTETKALDGISTSFRDKEFVAILGTSGSGKTTCLNIIGGLDQYDSGDLIINGKTTKNFKKVDWDAYRNNTIGFVFQSYNLISHLGIIENVEMAMTLSGISRREKRKRAIKVLEQVGLSEHMYKKPNQLSGGQMQRVAIARALANDPDILLCDEPTGALDTKTSVSIMELIKETAKDKLVIMVTHNPQLAQDYADRTIEFQDGKIIADSNPYEKEEKEEHFHLKRTSMNFLTALNLSFHNLRTKKGRTLLTSFASSIGIIGIAVILSLSGGFNDKINEFQYNSLSNFPVMVTQTTTNMDREEMVEQSTKMRNKMLGTYKDKDEYPDIDVVYPYDSSEDTLIHTNRMTSDYVDYVKKIDPNLVSSIGFTRMVGLNLVKKEKDKYEIVSPQDISFTSYPDALGSDDIASYIEKNYDLLDGKLPEKKTDMVLVVSEKNNIEKTVLEALGLDSEKEEISFRDITGLTLKSIYNNDYYKKTDMNIFMINEDLKNAYKKGNQLTITGIIRKKEEIYMAVLPEGIAYSDGLAVDFIENAKKSEIVMEQKNAEYNVLTGEKFSVHEENQGNQGMDNMASSIILSASSAGVASLTKDDLLSMLGENSKPSMITIYPNNFDAKDEITAYLGKWNDDKEEEDTVYYTDLAAQMTDLTGGIMNAITLVLIGFSSISLLVSLLMISIITYTSVLERTREIGVLKALGARKKDITRVFDAETFILGILSGCIGVLVAYLLTFPINSFIMGQTDLENVAVLKPEYGAMLIVISTILTMAGGHIPARMAAKKDAVAALRSE